MTGRFFQNKYNANTLWLLTERVLRLFSMLLVAAFIARHLEPESFGVYSYAISFVALFGAVTTLGLDGVVVRELVGDVNKDRWLGTAMVLRLAGAMLAIMVIAVAGGFMDLEPGIRLATLVISFGLICQAAGVADLYFQSAVVARYGCIARLSQVALSTLLKLTAVYLDAELSVFVGLLLLDALLLATAYQAVFRFHQGQFLPLRFDRTLMCDLLSAAKLLVLTDLLISMNTRVDQVMLQSLAGYEDVGVYAAAATLSEAWYFLPMVVSASLFPMLVKSHGRNRDEFLRQLQNLTNLLVWAALSLAVVTTLCSEWIINIVYGDEYTDSATVLAVHIWAGIFVFMGAATGKALLIESQYWVVHLRALSAFTINIAANLILIPRYGAVGAAWSLLLAHGVSYMFADMILRDSRYLMMIKFKALFLLDRQTFRMSNIGDVDGN